MTTEHQEYEAFVDKTVKQLRSSLKIDHTSKKRKVASLLESHVINTNESAAERVIRSRFLLGHDDDAYLRTGLSTLWSTAPDDDTGLELSPPGLYTPDAVDGIRSGLVSALKRKNRAMERNAPANLAALVPALKLLVTLPSVAQALATDDDQRAKLKALLEHNWSDAAKQDPKTLGPLRTQLLEFLGKLHKWLSSLRKDGGTEPDIAQLVLKAVEEQAQALKAAEAARAQAEADQRAKQLEWLEKDATCKNALSQLQQVKRKLNAYKTSTREDETKREDLEKAVAGLKLSIETQRKAQQERQKLEAEANTREKEFFQSILDTMLGSGTPNSDDVAYAGKLATLFARVAVTGMAFVATNSYEIFECWSSTEAVRLAATARRDAEALAADPDVLERCTAMRKKAKRGVNTEEYELLCINLMAWRLMQTKGKNQQLAMLKDVNDNELKYFIPLVKGVADRLEAMQAGGGVMDRVSKVLADWYSLSDTVAWQIGSQGDLKYLYATPADVEAERAHRDLFTKALQLALGIGVAGAVPGSSAASALAGKARAYFGGDAWESIRTTPDTLYDACMSRERSGYDMLIPGLRAIGGTDTMNAALALKCYEHNTATNPDARRVMLNAVGQHASSPVTSYTFNYAALQAQASTDDDFMVLLNGVLNIDAANPLVRYDNQTGHSHALAPHDSVLNEVNREIMPTFAANALVRIAGWESGLVQSIAERVNKPRFLDAMSTVTGIDDPKTLMRAESNDHCIVALVVGASVRLDVSDRMAIIANVTTAHVKATQIAMERTRVRSRFLHVARGPFDGAPVSLPQTFDRVLVGSDVMILTRVRIDYMVVSLESLLEKTPGWTLDGGTHLRVQSLLASPSFLQLYDDPITSTLSVEKVMSALGRPPVGGALGSTLLNDLPVQLLGAPLFRNIAVTVEQFNDIRSDAVAQLTLSNPKAMDNMLYKLKTQCEQNKQGDQLCMQSGQYGEWMPRVPLRTQLASLSGQAARYFEMALPIAGFLTAAVQGNALYLPLPNQFYMQSAIDDDDLSDWVVARGLVGQRGPACTAVKAPEGADKDIKQIDREADATIAMVDAQLAYALPSPVAIGKLMPHLKSLLDATSDPTAAEVNAALAALPASATTTTTTVAEVLAVFDGNYAVMGPTAAADNDDRGGIEVPHAVRWLPTADAAGRSVARAAALEHVAARCTQLAEAPDASEGVRAALREAAATLKLAQMAPLYATREAVAYGEHSSGCCRPLETKTTTLVTRPCAIVRGTLAMPVNAGVAHVDSEQRIKGDTQLDDANNAKQALEEYMSATRSVRAQARAQGLDPSVYVAPPPKALRFQRASAAATGVALASGIEVTERCSPHDFTAANWLRIVNRAIVATNSLHVETDQPSAANRVEGMLTALQGEGVTAESRRDGLWNEFRRKLGISGDRLWDFVRLMSGAVGGDVNELITMADEATMRATKAIQEERLAIAKRVSDMQAKIVETIVGSMAKESKLAFENDGNQFVVIDAEAKKRLKDLQSGQLGVPFFEANVAMRNLQNDDENAEKTTLSQLLSGLSQVGKQLQESLEQTLTRPGPVSASLADLSHPANCYFVSLRPDAVAAIRIAHERMNVELGLRGAGRRLSLYEVVEGGCSMLTTRFAEFAGHVLVQARSTTGISAMYVAPQAMHTNAIQARIALERLVHGAGLYGAYVNSPNWDKLTDQTADVQQERDRLMDAGSQVQEHTVGRVIRQAMRGPAAPAERFLNRGQWRVMNLPSR